MNINIQVLVIMGVSMISRSWNEAAKILKKIEAPKNKEPKLNDEEWSSWEMEVWRTWCMDWRSSYPSSYIVVRSLQDHMEVEMAQFRVKVSKNQVLDGQTRVQDPKLEFRTSNLRHESQTRANKCLQHFWCLWTRQTRAYKYKLEPTAVLSTSASLCFTFSPDKVW